MAQKGSGRGQDKWRDVGVYVDGRPVGVVIFGELPKTTTGKIQKFRLREQAKTLA